jgi:transposase
MEKYCRYCEKHRHRDRMVVAAYKAGMSLRQIASVLNITSETVRNILKRRGIPRRPKSTARPD